VGLRSRFASLAASGEVPVFAVVGGGHRSPLNRLRIAEGIRVVATPRHGAVLLVAGALPEAARQSVSHVHDQMAGPRVTVGWGHPDPTVVPVQASSEGDVEDMAAVIRKTFHDAVTGVISPEPPLLPDIDPVEWRGVGPYGHGGAGMTGGTPFGRPLALRAADRDGLELDSLPIVIGPWFPGFPPGMALRVSLQGDVAQEVEVASTGFVSAGPAGVFDRAVHEPVLIRDLEMARARHHLEWMADTLRIAGVDRLARVAGQVAAAVSPGEVGPVERLMAASRRSLLRPMTFRGVGVLPAEIDVAGLGPVARATGIADDRRASEQGYRDLDFRSVTRDAGDAWARFEQRAAEAVQAIDLAGRAGDARAFGDGEVEGPDGLRRSGGPGPADGLLSMLPTVLAGMEWGDLVTTVQSLDIDMESVSVESTTV
jgi:respiratory-subunit NADH dehydrogenase subunit